jgi:hypothetical protein
MHNLIKGNMLSHLDGFGNGVEIENVLHGLGVAEKNTNTGIRKKTVRTTRASRESINAATKDTKEAEVRLATKADLKGGSGTGTMDSYIVEAEVVMEGIRPESDRKIGTAKHGTKSIANGLMGTFTRTILVRRVGGSRFDAIASMFEEINHFTTATKITTKVKADIFVRRINRKTMEGKPAIQKVDGGSFGAKRFTI